MERDDEQNQIKQAVNNAKLRAALLWQLTIVSAGHLNNAANPAYAEAAMLANEAHEHATMTVKLLLAAAKAAEKVQ